MCSMPSPRITRSQRQIAAAAFRPAPDRPDYSPSRCPPSPASQRIAACRSGDTGRGKKLSGFPSPAPSILWTKQEIDVAIVNGAWALVDQPGRYRLTASTTLFVDVTNGNDANDGLASGAGNALATIQKAWDTAADNFDLAGQSLTIQLADGTYSAGLATSKAMIGANGPASVVIV